MYSNKEIKDQKEIIQKLNIWLTPIIIELPINNTKKGPDIFGDLAEEGDSSV